MKKIKKKLNLLVSRRQMQPAVQRSNALCSTGQVNWTSSAAPSLEQPAASITSYYS